MYLIICVHYFILFAIRAMQSSHDKDSAIVLSFSLHHRSRSQMNPPSCVVDCCIVWHPTNEDSAIMISCSLHHCSLSQMTPPSCVVDCCIVWHPTNEDSAIVLSCSLHHCSRSQMTPWLLHSVASYKRRQCNHDKLLSAPLLGFSNKEIVRAVRYLQIKWTKPSS
jgi:hypothetical protein